MLDALAALLSRVTRLMNAAGTSVVLFIMLVILADVVGRGAFSSPLPGTPEIVAMSIAVVVYLQFPSTLAAGRVIAADGLVGWLATRSVRAEQWLLAVHHVIGAMLFAATAWFVWPLVRTAFTTGDFYGTDAVFKFPKWPILSVVLFGSAMMALQYLVLAAQFIRAGRDRRALQQIDPADKVIS